MKSTKVENWSNFDKKGTKHFNFTDELWGVYCECLGEKCMLSTVYQYLFKEMVYLKLYYSCWNINGLVQDCAVFIASGLYQFISP